MDWMKMKKAEWTRAAGIFALSIGLCFSGTNLQAQEKKKPLGPNADRGLALADQLCSGCHIVSPKQTSSAGAGIPSFRAIANRPSQTSAHIANVLIKPHAPMPNMQLSRYEIMDIIAYLDQLRSKDAGLPLLKRPKGGGKPKFPRSS